MDFDLIMPAALVAPLMRHAEASGPRLYLQGFWVGPADRMGGEEHDSIVAVTTDGVTMLVVRSPGFARKWSGWEPTPLGTTTLKKATVGRDGPRMLFGIPTSKQSTREAVIWQAKELTDHACPPSPSGFRPDKATLMEKHETAPDFSKALFGGVTWKPGSAGAVTAVNLRRACETSLELCRLFSHRGTSASLQFLHNGEANETGTGVHAVSFGTDIPALLLIMPVREALEAREPAWLTRETIWKAMGIEPAKKQAAA